MIDKHKLKMPSERMSVGGPGVVCARICDDCQQPTGRPKTVMRLRRGAMKGMRGTVCPQCAPAHVSKPAVLAAPEVEPTP